MDGSPLPSVQRQAVALITAGALDEVVRLCDLEIEEDESGLSSVRMRMPHEKHSALAVRAPAETPGGGSLDAAAATSASPIEAAPGASEAEEHPPRAAASAEPPDGAEQVPKVDVRAEGKGKRKW